MGPTNRSFSFVRDPASKKRKGGIIIYKNVKAMFMHAFDIVEFSSTSISCSTGCSAAPRFMCELCNSRKKPDLGLLHMLQEAQATGQRVLFVVVCSC